MKRIIKNKFKNSIIVLFSLLIKFLSFLFFYTPKIFNVLNFNERNRFYRSVIIRQTVVLLKQILKSLNYNLPITITKNKVIVDVDGVLIVPGEINRYFKIDDNIKYHNEAKKLEKLFDFSKAKVFIDIGACIGEYSIYFAKKYPQSKIYSIEASKNNLKLFKENIKINNTEHSIKIIENAISDIENQNYYVSGRTQQSEVFIGGDNSQKKTITLSSLISDEKIEKIDFLKIDIENSNYKVAKCIIDNASKIDAIQYEFYKGPSSVFLDLVYKVSSFYNFYLYEEKEDKFTKVDKNNLEAKIKSENSEIKNNFDVFFRKKYD